MKRPGGLDKKNRSNNLMSLEARRKRVADLYLQGMAQFQIAEELGVSQASVSNDLTAIRAEWLALAVIDYSDGVAKELAKIDHLEEVAWEAWQRSCEDAEQTRRRREFIREKVKGKPRGHRLVPVSSTVETTRRGQAGDPRFLDKVSWCIDQRCKLLGLVKAPDNKVQIINVNWDSLFDRAPEPDPIAQRLAQEETGKLPGAQDGDGH
jgi:DNA-binding CsgD family transcriptional regulator